MRVFTHNKVAGHWPGMATAAVVVAEDPRQALRLLEVAMNDQGLQDPPDADGLVEIDIRRAGAIILQAGYLP